MSYLEEFVNSISYLPGEVVRSLELIRLLDSKTHQHVQDMNSLSKEYFANLKRESDRVIEDSDLLDKIKHRQYQSISLSDEKIVVSSQISTILERHINQLNTDLANFKNELQYKLDDKIDDPFPSGNKKKKIDNVMEELSYLEGSELGAYSPAEYADDVETEQLYCICNQPNFGRMIECENPQCEKKWFHFTCVGLETNPKGKWYCPMCQEL